MPAVIKAIAIFAVGFTLVLLSGCRSAAGLSSGAADPGETVAVSKVASRFGFDRVEEAGNRITLRGKVGTLEMEAESRCAAFNRVAFWLSAPPFRQRGEWRMLQSDVDAMLAPLAAPPKAVQSEGSRIVLLDPGHGGEDGGAANGRFGIQEKQATLALATVVRDLLRERGVDARLTRNDDRSMDLQARCDYAEKIRADVFVSIHLNSAANTRSSGIEVHILPPAGRPATSDAAPFAKRHPGCPGNVHDGANLVLGHLLQTTLLKLTGAEDRGVRRSRFHVIRQAPCPAALVECGFLSNRQEAQRLREPEYQAHLAQALAEGILAYLDTVKRARSTPPAFTRLCVSP